MIKSFRLSANGLRAVNSDRFFELSPSIYELLMEVENNPCKYNKSSSFSEKDDMELLLSIGLLKVSASNNHTVEDLNINQYEPTIHSIKSKFVELLKRDFHEHEKFWDVLLNLESVDDKNGLLWFMSKVTEMVDVAHQQYFRVLFEQLLGVNDEQ